MLSLKRQLDVMFSLQKDMKKLGRFLDQKIAR